MKYLLIVTLLALWGCKRVPEEGTARNPHGVVAVVQIDDCTVYRFSDKFQYHYTTICPHGFASTDSIQKEGKASYEESIDTNQ